MKKLVLCIAITMCASCSKVGKYVYISPTDGMVVVHVDRKCKKITVCRRANVDYFKTASNILYCNECVDDKTYEELLK